MIKKILIFMFLLAILLIGGGTYLIYYGTTQLENKSESKKEKKQNQETNTNDLNGSGKLAFLSDAYESEIPDDNSFDSRVNLVKKYTTVYFSLLEDSRDLGKNSYGQESIDVPAYDVNVVMEGVGAYQLEEENTMKMLQRNFNIANQQQELYNEKMKEYAGAGPAQRADIQNELDTIENRFPEIEKSNADLFENFFPYL